MRAKASSLLIATAFLLSAESLFLACGRKHQSGQTTIPASAEPQKAWRWVDPNLKVRSRADLDEILKQHRFWLEFTRSEDFRESGEDRGDPPAELGEAILNGAELSRAILDEAQLNDAFLKGANLARANLDGADLTHADLTSANLDHAYLEGADLSRAYLGDADLSSANLSGAHLNDAWLRNDPFDASSKAPNLSNANLTGADLTRADLSNANLTGADLARADLSDAHLEGADLGHAELGGVVFRPAELPMLSPLAAANGLESMAYKHDPGQLTQLRKRFQDAGYREQERAITCALNRHNAIPSELHESLKQKSKSLRGEKFDPNKIMSFKSFIEGRFKWVAFDLTCEYGFSDGRPLRIVGLLWLLFSITYVVFMHRPGTSGIYLVGTRWSRGRSNTQGMQISPHAIGAAKWWKLPFLWLRREWRVLRAAMFFSLMSAFNIGFRDINFGRWLRLLTKREYDLKAVGWARTVSGFQSLLSVYLIALWVLTYFGRPFG